jgi:hypothetical protein
MKTTARALQEEAANSQRRYDALKTHAEAKIEQYGTHMHRRSHIGTRREGDSVRERERESDRQPAPLRSTQGAR